MQGYITIATGPEKYLLMAANFAASVKVMDPDRPVCVVHDPGADLPAALRRVCDHLVPLPPDTRYPGVINKLRLFEISPYAQTMFVDADCLLVKRDVARHWAAAEGSCFAITGTKRQHGTWYDRDIAQLLAEQGAPYLVQMNSGVFYFDRSDAAATFFAELNAFYLERRESLRLETDRPERRYPDELFFGVFMGLRGMAPVDRAPSEASWMVSTWRALFCAIDPARGRSVIYKPTGHLGGIPLLPTGWHRLSPTFAHFIGLKPHRLYARLAQQFRQAAGAH